MDQSSFTGEGKEVNCRRSTMKLTNTSHETAIENYIKYIE